MKNVGIVKSTPGTVSQSERSRALVLVLFPLLLLLASAPSAPGQTGESRLEAARELVSEKRFAQAIPLLQAEVRAHAEDDEARYLLARVLSWERRFEESLEEYRTLLRRKPGDPAYRAGYARVLAWSGRHDEAIREFRGAIAADSTNLETRIGYARALSWGGDLAGASMEYRRILSADPDLGDAWLGLATVARWRGAPTASDRFVERAGGLGADEEGVAEERKAVRAALGPSVGGGWTAFKERQYVTGPDFTLEAEGPHVQGRATVARAVGLAARVAWLTLTETPASGDSANYDLESVEYSADAAFLRGYPWQATLGARYRTFESRDGGSRFPLVGDDTFWGFGARLWRFTGRFTPHAAARRDYIAVKDTTSGGVPAFDPGHVEDYEAGLAWQWSGRGTLDGLVSRGLYSDDNRRWTAAGGLAYRVKTRVPTISLDGRVLYRDWDDSSPSYFTPLQSVRGSVGASIAGYRERPDSDYGFRYEISGLTSSNFDDIWAHSWSGYFNVTAFDLLPVGIEAAYSVDNNSYETWFLGFNGSFRW